MLDILKLLYFKPCSGPNMSQMLLGQMLNSNRWEQTLFCVTELLSSVQVTWCLFNLIFQHLV